MTTASPRPRELDGMPALRAPTAPREPYVPEAHECTCPELCLLDHDN